MIERTSLSAAPEVGATSTFEDFFIAEHERLFKALYMLTGNQDEADDLAQEALMRAYERWERVGTMDSPAGYVYRTALNLHRNRLRGLVVRARRVFAAIPTEDFSGPLSASHDFGARSHGFLASSEKLWSLSIGSGLDRRRRVRCSASIRRP